MDCLKLQNSFSCLGLSPEATMHDVEKSFRELRNLYSEDTLATYSLLDDAARQQKLEALQEAYDNILQSRQQSSKADNNCGKDGIEEDSDAQISVDANPEEAPGLFLKQTRKASGVSLREMADRTKIGTFHLQSIEEQNFEALPAPVYLRGFLREMTRMLKISDADTLIANFMALYQNNQQD